MYNSLFGKNPDGPTLLSILGLTEEKIGRYRDAWVTKDGEIAIHTRLGSGPRACYCDETQAEKERNQREANKHVEKLFIHGMPTQKMLDEDYYQTHKVFVSRKPRSDDVRHEKFCWYPYVRRLQNHPMYLREEIEKEVFDDKTCAVTSGDSTYATFFFKIPPEIKTKMLEIQERQNTEYEKSHAQRFDELMANLKSMPQDRLEAEFPDIVKMLQKPRK